MAEPRIPAALSVLLLVVALAQVCTVAAPPNIVIILADDLGYGSVGCYGADPKLVQTPNIDRLAREGMRFTDGNTPSSVCTPTRYALLTGRYCWRTRPPGSTLSVFDPLLIETGRPTLASLLKARGYHTAAIGKWHLGYGDRPQVDYTGRLSPGPRTVGFDYHFGVPQNNGDRTGVFVENERVLGLRSARLAPSGKLTNYGAAYLGLDAPQRDEPETMTELGTRAVVWIERLPRGEPFFAYLATTAVHEPIWPGKAVSGTSAAGPFGDFVHDLDRFVGRVRAALEAKGVLDDTFLLFSSDNGGVILKSRAGRNPAIFDAQQAGLKMNGDWRGSKHTVFEGGFRVPLIVRWPGRVAAGSVAHSMVNLVDVYATVAEVVGKAVDATVPGGEDSVSFLASLLGRMAAPARASMIVHSAWGNYAIRDGEWKYIEGKPHLSVRPETLTATKEQHLPQLYRLRDDAGETNNVIAQHPEVAARLARLLDAQRRSPSSRELAAAKPGALPPR